MTNSHDVVVVGAGIIGASIAYQIARRSELDVVLLDKGTGPGEGSTGASSSIIRCRYSHPDVVRLARHGQLAYRDWNEFTGLAEPTAHYAASGVLWLFDELDELDATAARLSAAGVATSVVGPDEFSARFPQLSPCVAAFDLTGEVPHVCRPLEKVLVEDESGFGDPVASVVDLVESFRRVGGEVRFGATVSGVRRDGEKVTGVELTSGTTLSAGLVINAAGPWCNQLNRLAGVDLHWPLIPTRVQVAYRDWPADLPTPPVVADGSTGLYFRPDANGSRVLFGSVLAEDEEEAVDDPDAFNRASDASFRDVKIHGLHHRVPALEYRGLVTGMAGLYTVNRTDVHPVVGPTELDGFWVANGFSGHGFKLGPAIGSMVAQAITGETASFDTDVPLALFARDREPIGVSAKNVLA